MLSAVIAGLITGVVVTLLEMVTTMPLIAQAEVYEESGQKLEAIGAAAAQPIIQTHNHGAGPWEPKAGFERIFYTGVTTILVAMGYAMFLGACLSQIRSASWQAGLALGAAGYLVFQLAPALGLPPEPPGSAYVDLATRKLWWMGTAIATALTLAAWVYAWMYSKFIWIAVGIGLIALPHIIGAPTLTSVAGKAAIVPHELSQRFALAALFAAAVFWLVLGGVQGFVFEKLSQRQVVS